MPCYFIFFALLAGFMGANIVENTVLEGFYCVTENVKKYNVNEVSRRMFQVLI